MRELKEPLVAHKKLDDAAQAEEVESSEIAYVADVQICHLVSQNKKPEMGMCQALKESAAICKETKAA